MGRFNPHAPNVLGVEWPALYQRDVPLDAGIEYGQTFASSVAESIGSAFTYFSASPSAEHRFHLLGSVYEKGAELATGPIQRTIVPVNGGTLGVGGTLNGGATIAACLASPADDLYVQLGSSGGDVAVQFATGAMFVGKRILRLVLHHATEAGTNAENPELGPLLTFQSASDLALYGFLESARAARTADLGEIQPVPPTGAIATSTERLPWIPTAVQSLDSSTTRFRLFNTLADGAPRSIHYLALEVVWCEENRVAIGGRRFAADTFTNNAIASVGYQSVPLYTPAGIANWAKPASGEFTATFCLADTGGPWLDASGSDVDSFGPVPSIPLLDSFTVFAPHEGRAMPRGVDNEPRSADPVSGLPPILLYTPGFTASTDTDPYASQLAAPVYAGVDAVQEIQQLATGVSTPYPWVRFWARRYGDSEALAVTCGGQTVTLLGAELEALPEIVGGWRYVTLKWPTAPTFANTGANKAVTFSSFGTADARWEILGALMVYGGVSSLYPSYGGYAAAATHGGTRDVLADLAVNVALAAPTVYGLTATPKTYPVAGFGLDCGEAPGCIPTDIDYIDLIWTGTPVTGTGVTGFGYYEVQRKDTDPTSSEYRTIGKPADQTAPHFTDFEARIGILSTYRVRIVRNDGTAGDWSAPASGTPPAIPGAAAGVLVFTSNVDPTRSAAYGEAFTGSASEDFGFVEAETRQLQRLYQRDYQTAFRPTERGGVTFSRALLIGATANPAAPVPATYGSAHYGTSAYGTGAKPSADHGFDRLRDLAWDPDMPYVCVLDDLGNRWLANVNVPSGNVRRRLGLFVAQIVVTEVTATPAIPPSPPAPDAPAAFVAPIPVEVGGAYPGGYEGGY